MKLIKETQKGFTLVEILITVLIILALTYLAVANYRQGAYQFDLNRSAHYLAQEIRRVEELEMSTRESLTGELPPGGYGIHLYKQGINYSIITFADENEDHQYDTDDTELEELILEGPIYIEALYPNGSDVLDIVFISPDPTVWINRDDTCASATITLKEPVSVSTININVYKSGLIEVE